MDASNIKKSGTYVPIANITGLTSTQMAAAFFKDEDAMTSDSATAVASQQSIKAHVAAAFPDDDAFGSWASKSANTEYTAASDGFVLAYGGANQVARVETPTGTIRIRTHAHGAANAGIECPVRKGDTWKLFASAAMTVFWLPIGA